MPDSVVHFEIPADDVERAARFYKEVFGWDTNSIPGMGYTMLSTTETGDQGPTTPGAINGGMMPRQGEITSPVITINVEDVDAALERLTKGGGQVVLGKQAVGDMGFTGYFRDTEGNLLGLWQTAPS